MRLPPCLVALPRPEQSPVRGAHTESGSSAWGHSRAEEGGRAGGAEQVQADSGRVKGLNGQSQNEAARWAAAW